MVNQILPIGEVAKTMFLVHAFPQLLQENRSKEETFGLSSVDFCPLQ